MRIAEEMYARGIEIEPISLDKVEPSAFSVYGDKVIPSLTSIGGLGEKPQNRSSKKQKKSYSIRLTSLNTEQSVHRWWLITCFVLVF